MATTSNKFATIMAPIPTPEHNSTSADSNNLPNIYGGGSPKRPNSSSFIEDINYEIDPDSVDFEPLLVSGGTGKILSYHSESHVEEILSLREELDKYDDAGRFSDRCAMSIEEERDGHKRQNPSYHTFFRLALPLFFVFIALKGFLWMDIHKIPYLLEKSSAKSESRVRAFYAPLDDFGNGPDLDQRMVNVDTALHNNDSEFGASTSNLVVWEPFLHQQGVSTYQMRDPFVSIMPVCFNRAAHEFQMDHVTGSYQMYVQNPSLSLQTSKDSSSLRMAAPPMAVFTPSFQSAAITLSEQLHTKGVYFAFLHSPTDIYVDQYLAMKSQQKLSEVNGTSRNNNGNLLVRHLNGSTTQDREVVEMDLNRAKELLRSKFFIITCDYPYKSITRLGRFRGGEKLPTISNISDDNLRSPRSMDVESEIACKAKKEEWAEECIKMKKKWQRNRNSLEPGILEQIETANHFDVLLYEYAMELFQEQNALF